jgi:DtxR family Mn-dependent transcriptional regulator
VSIEDLSSAAQDCLKVIWRSTEWSDAPVTTKGLSEALGVAPSTVSEMVRRLSNQGLVEHAPYSSIALSEAGRRIALAMVRRHRLIETMLVTLLGYTWDEVHAEAEELEHAVSERLIDRIDAVLGYPELDPHGDPIPRRDGSLTTAAAQVLAATEVQISARAARIADDDPELLRYLASVGVDIGVRVKVLERRTVAGVARIAVESREEDVFLGEAAQRSIWVDA